MDSDSEDGLLLAAAACLIKKRKRTQSSCWTRPWLLRRNMLGAYHALLPELQHEDPGGYTNFLRMEHQQFEELLAKVEPLIQKQSTVLRESIPAGERLAITLRFLASGDSYHSLAFLYRVSTSAISAIVPETCSAIYASMKDDFLKVPSTADEWQEVASQFADKWQYPNCIGAIDGKHIAIRAPANSGSTFHNYKMFYSIVLMAVVDAACRFIIVDVGANGRSCDAGVFANSAMATALENGTLGIPEDRPLPGRVKKMPFVIIGDEAFGLKRYMMKPYPSRQLSDDERIFNYRLSRARRVSENAFGILSNRFRVLDKHIHLSPEKSTTVTNACIVLHNFLLTRKDVRYNRRPNDSEPGTLQRIGQQGGNINHSEARQIRDEFADFFNTNGAVEWQWSIPM